jgi:hypothetical protein
MELLNCSFELIVTSSFMSMLSYKNLTPQATSPTMQLMLPTPKQMSMQTQSETQELNLHQRMLIMLKAVCMDV